MTPPKRSPPIVLHDQTVLPQIRKVLEKRKSGFKYNLAMTSPRIQLAVINDFRWLTKALEAQNIKFHGFCLKDVNVVEAVIRNVPDIRSEQEISEEFVNLGFSIKNVHTMRNAIRNFPLVVV